MRQAYVSAPIRSAGSNLAFPYRRNTKISLEYFSPFRQVLNEREILVGGFASLRYRLCSTLRPRLGKLHEAVPLHRVLDWTRWHARDTPGLWLCREAASLGRSPGRAELTMDELTKKQADELRKAAEYLTLQMRLTPHPTERSRIRAMADTADFVAERIDAHLAASQAQSAPTRTPIGEFLRRLPLGNYK